MVHVLRSMSCQAPKLGHDEGTCFLDTVLCESYCRFDLALTTREHACCLLPNSWCRLEFLSGGGFLTECLCLRVCVCVCVCVGYGKKILLVGKQCFDRLTLLNPDFAVLLPFCLPAPSCGTFGNIVRSASSAPWAC